ncbi:NADP-dependent oxidoreductase [Streptomyces sp. NPDC094038]|uniref:NADP-dependent oxidoreductase n=1 Tax=Streptomyces sp. NPDC094038 TaxID=3366055 RepID=UPI0037FA5859
MKAFVVERYGDKTAPHAGEIPDPPVGTEDVLLQVRAAGVNPLDYKLRDGEFKAILPYRMPFALGNDMAGVVVEVGEAVTRLAVGEEVYARSGKDRIGTFAEPIALHQDGVAFEPAPPTMEEAASLPLVAPTAWQALVERAQVQPGQKVLVQAGSGGVGTIAIQLAKQPGATVATSTSKTNIDLVKSLGADIVVDYRQQAFETFLHDYDLVLDALGGKNVEKSLQVVRPGGKVIGIAGPPDADFAREPGANPVIRPATSTPSFRARRRARQRNVTYAFLFMRAGGDQLREIATLVDAAKIRPVVDRVFPFDSTPQALAYSEGGRRPARSSSG